ncbi:flavodoxin domain-containing protein [bacterium]
MRHKKSNPMLVVYASWTGSSLEISRHIANVLNQNKYNVTCIDARDNPDIAKYQSLIIGGGIRGGCFHPELIRFVTKNEEKLSQLTIAYFVVCLTMRENNEINRCSASKFIQTLQQKAPMINPVSVGLFGGLMNYDKFSGVMKLFVRMLHFPQGDFRDWKAIEQWALHVAPMLTNIRD